MYTHTKNLINLTFVGKAQSVNFCSYTRSSGPASTTCHLKNKIPVFNLHEGIHFSKEMHAELLKQTCNISKEWDKESQHMNQEGEALTDSSECRPWGSPGLSAPLSLCWSHMVGAFSQNIVTLTGLPMILLSESDLTNSLCGVSCYVLLSAPGWFFTDMVPHCM